MYYLKSIATYMQKNQFLNIADYAIMVAIAHQKHTVVAFAMMFSAFAIRFVVATQQTRHIIILY